MILSLKRTGSFDMFDKIRNNVFLVGVLINTGEAYTYSCELCDGNGYVDCDNCNGSGNETCPQCNGDGTERCFECSGDGEVSGDEGPEECGECGGEGEIDCGECGGDESISCTECGGNGSQDCQDCDGQGELESDTRTLIETRLYLSWNKNLENLAELRDGTTDSIGSDDQIDTMENTVLVGVSGGHGEPEDFVQQDEKYIYYVSDDLSDVQLDTIGGKTMLFTKKGIADYINYYE